jgi:molybdenum cofactor cytidylyltransferase
VTTAIVLAAGASTRLGRPKQLVTIDGETLVERATRIALEACGRVIVVIPSGSEGPGWPGAEVTTYSALGIRHPVLRVVVNEHAAEGIASSIRLGVEACDDDVLLVLCDQPRITAAHLRALAEAGAPIAATAYVGIAGVPAFFAQPFRDELLALRGDSGARRVIDAHRDVVAAIAFEEAAVDIDTEADLADL